MEKGIAISKPLKQWSTGERWETEFVLRELGAKTVSVLTLRARLNPSVSQTELPALRISVNGSWLDETRFSKEGPVKKRTGDIKRTVVIDNRFLVGRGSSFDSLDGIADDSTVDAHGSEFQFQIDGLIAEGSNTLVIENAAPESGVFLIVGDVRLELRERSAWK